LACRQHISETHSEESSVFVRFAVYHLTLNLMRAERSNQTLQPTPSRLVSSFFMTKILQEIAIRALARRG